MGFRQIEPDAQIAPLVPRLRYDEIESAVTRALQEELARLDELEEKGEELETKTARPEPGGLIEP